MSLLCVEVVLLSIAVISRYVFAHPLVWTDELAQALLLWLGMIGAAMAIDRGSHMRLGTFVNMLPAAWRAAVKSAAALVVVGFVVVMLVPAQERIVEQSAIFSSALHFNDAWRVAAVFTGLVLIGIFALRNALEAFNWRSFLAGALGAAVVVVAIGWIGAHVAAAGNANAALGLFYLVLLGAFIAAGVPIAFAFGSTVAAYLLCATPVPASVIVGRIDEGMSGLVLLAVPLFILLGLLIDVNGMARALIDLMNALVGHLRGGLSYVLLGAVFIVSGISGSKIADLAAVGPALLPEMEKRGIDRREMLGLLTASGAMAETIPPSIALIIVGSVTSVSIAALFTGGLVPALIAAIALAALVAIRSRNEPVAARELFIAARAARTHRLGAPGARAADLHSLGGSRRRCHRDRSVDRRHRV